MKLVILLLPIFVFLVGFIIVNNDRSMRTVLGVSTSAYRTGTINWKKVPGASGFNIYYKQQADKEYKYSVGNLPSTSTNYTINYLKKNKSYQYVVKAFDSFGKEFWSSGQLWIWKYK